MQVKLLRAIQEKRVRKVGATQEDPVDVRIICATHRTCRAGGRRALPAGPVLPPERDRAEHAAAARLPRGHPLIAVAILERLAAQAGTTRAAHARGVRRAHALRFPGNIRELENILERALALSTSQEIGSEDLRLTPPQAAAEERAESSSGKRCPTTSTGWSAKRSSMRCRKPGSTVRRRPSFSASPSGNCATGCSASASAMKIDPDGLLPQARYIASRIATSVRPGKRSRSSSCTRSACRRAIRRRCDRAAVHQPARPARIRISATSWR